MVMIPIKTRIPIPLLTIHHISVRGVGRPLVILLHLSRERERILQELLRLLFLEEEYQKR